MENEIEWEQKDSTKIGYPKWMVYNGNPYQNGWFGGSTIFGNTHFEKKTRHLCGLQICGKKQKSQSLWYEFLCMACEFRGTPQQKKWPAELFSDAFPSWVCVFLILFNMFIAFSLCISSLGRCLLDLREKHMRWPAGSEEKRTHAIPRLYGRGFFLASFGNFGFDFLVYQSITYILTDSTHLFTNKRLIHVSVLIFPLISLCIPVSLFKPAETRLFKRLFYACFLQVHQSTHLWVGYWESSTLGWSVMIRRSNCPCNIRVFRNSL